MFLRRIFMETLLVIAVGIFSLIPCYKEVASSRRSRLRAAPGIIRILLLALTYLKYGAQKSNRLSVMLVFAKLCVLHVFLAAACLSLLCSKIALVLSGFCLDKLLQ